MTAPLNHDEQARVDAYNELEAARRAGQHVYDHELAEAKQLAEQARNNADLRAKHMARLEAERQERQAQQAQRQMELVDTEIAALKQRARAGFLGTPAQFEEAWPEILRRWQVDRAVAALDVPTGRNLF